MTNKPTTAGSTQVRSPGVISADEVYTKAEFRRRCRIGDYIWRKLRGHLVRRVGRKGFVLGSDWLAFLQQQPPDAAVDQGGPAA